MSQHDMVIENQGFAATRADINAALAALATNSSGATEPATTYAYQLWADVTANRLKIRNAANDAWISLLVLSTGAPVLGVAAGAITASGLTQATARMLGRSTAGAGAVEEISLASTLELLAGVLGIKDASVTPAKLTQPFVLGTAVATTSGASVSFSSIPAYVSEIKLKLFAVSLTGAADHFLVRLGTAGALATSGYASSGIYASTGTTNTSTTAGVIFPAGAAGNATITWSGEIFISRVSATEWEVSGALFADNGAALFGGGRITLAGQLDIVGLTNNGSSTFDNGKVNISYK